MSQIADRAEIAKFHQRIGRRLQVNDPSILLKRAFHVLRVRSIDIAERHPEIGEYLVKQPRSAAIQIVPRHHVVPGLEHANDRIDRRHPAGEHFR